MTAVGRAQGGDRLFASVVAERGDAHEVRHDTPGTGCEGGIAPGSLLAALAADWSPRVEQPGEAEVVFDVGGLSTLFGAPHELARRIAADALARDLAVRLAVAPTRVAARALALGRVGVTVVGRGREAAALASLPVVWLPRLDDPGDPASRGTIERAREAQQRLATLARWGITTFGALAALPAASLHARLGETGPRWQRLARGLDPRPLVVTPPEVRYDARMALDWPIDTLEPLAFVLARVLDPLCARLAAHGRAALGVRLWLRLVTREVDRRRLQWPLPLGDARALRTLLMLDLEARRPGAGIDEIVIEIEPGDARHVQETLFSPPVPPPEHVSTLVARLSALMGEGRVGTPVPSDSHRPGAFMLTPFDPSEERSSGSRQARATATRSRHEPNEAVHVGVERHPPGAMLRRFRPPVAARVRLKAGCPAHVTTRHAGLVGGAVRHSAGPYRTSGHWWRPGDEAAQEQSAPWDRDDWDVAITDGAVYRISLDRLTGQWSVDGAWD